VKNVKITGRSSISDIRVGESLRRLPDYIPVERSVILTDTNVRRYYEKDFPPCPVIEIGCGEGIKTLDTVQHIYKELLDLSADRSAFIAAVGGGIVCDIAGFAASTYLRGIRFGFVASTLLAQVDASVGGKNGVNVEAYKNMVGTFNQPEFVICDLEMLQTLPEKERLCGFAEIVKHAAIADAALFRFLEENHRSVTALDLGVLERLVCTSVQIKAGVVNRDEREMGERRKLNFGHTLGHAVERITGLSHGEAVAIGMAAAALFSCRRGRLRQAEADRLLRLLGNLGLPVKLELDKAQIIDAVSKDKKREGEHIHFVMLKQIGSAVIERVSLQELEEVLDDLCLHC
jgi:3-dehydroquinate synthase